MISPFFIRTYEPTRKMRLYDITATPYITEVYPKSLENLKISAVVHDITISKFLHKKASHYNPSPSERLYTVAPHNILTQIIS